MTKSLEKFTSRSNYSLQWKVLIVVLFSAACGVALYFVYQTLSDLEERNFDNEYTALANGLGTQMANVIRNTKLGSQQISTTYALKEPNASVWPNVYLNLTDTQQIFQPIQQITYVYHFFCPLVTPSQVASFEAFAAEMYASDPDLPDSVGVSPFGFGIFAMNTSTTPPSRYHVTTGENEFSQYNYITPLFQNAIEVSPRQQYLKNVHSEELQTIALDEVYECFLNGSTACQAISELFIPVFMEQIASNYNSLHFTGIFVENELVGFVAFPMHWVNMFIQGVPAEQMKDIYFSISSPQTSFTIHMQDDVVSEIVNIKHKSHGITVSLSEETDAVEYLLTIYPSEEFYNDRHTLLPLFASLGLGVVFCLLMVLGLLHSSIMSMKLERAASKRLDSAKHNFVRVLIHEVRTPLQSIILGLELLRSELGTTAEPINISSEKDSSEEKLITQAASIVASKGNVNTISEIQTGLEMDTILTVSTLDDLVEYDRLQVTQFNTSSNVSKTPTLLMPLLLEVLRPAKRQAVRSQCQLSFAIDVPHQDDLPGSGNVNNTNDDSEATTYGPILSVDELAVGADGDKLEHLCRHILNNALKHSATDATVEVVLTWRLSGEPYCKEYPQAVASVPPRLTDSSVLLSVCSFGTSIAPKYQNFLMYHDVIFDPEELQVGQGSGIGLWVAKVIAEEHGGALWMSVCEDVECSCTIHVELPLVNIPAPAGLSVVAVNSFGVSQQDNLMAVRESTDIEMPPTSVEVVVTSSNDTAVHDDPTVESVSESATSSDRNTNRHMVKIAKKKLKIRPRSLSRRFDVDGNESPLELRKVMIVDDAPAIRKLFDRVLSRQGATVNTACDGQQCVDKMRAEGDDYGCILMDYEMPVMNGPDATKLVREMGYTPERLLIVGVTGNTLFKDIQFFKECGADEVLRKPADMTVLKDLLVPAGCLPQPETIPEE